LLEVGVVVEIQIAELVQGVAVPEVIVPLPLKK
jgi:hypothetical protein